MLLDRVYVSYDPTLPNNVEPGGGVCSNLDTFAAESGKVGELLSTRTTSQEEKAPVLPPCVTLADTSRCTANIAKM